MVEFDRNDLLAIGTTFVLISPAKARQEFILTNTSTGAEKITISFAADAKSLYGVVLLPYSVYSSPVMAQSVFQGDIYAICDGAGGQLSIMER